MSQAPLKGCRCEPLVRKLENQLQATKEEVQADIHAVHHLINSKVGQQEHRNTQQVTNTHTSGHTDGSNDASHCQIKLRIHPSSPAHRSPAHDQFPANSKHLSPPPILPLVKKHEQEVCGDLLSNLSSLLDVFCSWFWQHIGGQQIQTCS